MESPHRSPAPVAAHYIPYVPGDDRVYKRRYNVIKQLVYKLEDENNLIALKIAQTQYNIQRMTELKEAQSRATAGPSTTTKKGKGKARASTAKSAPTLALKAEQLAQGIDRQSLPDGAEQIYSELAPDGAALPSVLRKWSPGRDYTPSDEENERLPRGSAAAAIESVLGDSLDEPAYQTADGSAAKPAKKETAAQKKRASLGGAKGGKARKSGALDGDLLGIEGDGIAKPPKTKVARPRKSEDARRPARRVPKPKPVPAAQPSPVDGLQQSAIPAHNGPEANIDVDMRGSSPAIAEVLVPAAPRVFADDEDELMDDY